MTLTRNSFAVEAIERVDRNTGKGSAIFRAARENLLDENNEQRVVGNAFCLKVRDPRLTNEPPFSFQWRYTVTARSSSAIRPQTKEGVRDKLAAGWARVLAKPEIGRGAFADTIGCHPDTVGNALAGNSTPELHTVLNSLIVDPTALDELFALYGIKVSVRGSDPANDLNVIADMNDASSDFLHRLLDGQRCHRDTAALAKLFRPLIQKMQSIVDEAEAA